MFGLGTIGLAVIDALREVGASKIIGVDMDEGKFDRAKTWGATHLLNPSKLDESVVVSIPAFVHESLIHYLFLHSLLSCHSICQSIETHALLLTLKTLGQLRLRYLLGKRWQWIDV